MAQETEAAAGVKSQPRDHIDEDEVTELQRPRSFYDGVREQAERFASTRLGQFMIERGDRALRMIEDTAKWSLPQEKSADPLQRPLPWGPFLLLIIMLRLTRMWLSVGALMIGNSPISPSDMVYFIQTRRRKLRAIRVHGLKVMRQRQQEVSYGSGKGLTQKLTQWFSRAMCRPGVQRANSGRLFQVRNMEQTTQTSPAVMKRPREEEANTEADADHNLTIDQMLAKYAQENSEDDSDFVPNPDEEEESSDGTSSESNTSEEISSDEANENAVQATKKPPTLVVENGVHKAEPNERKDKEMEMAKENDKGKLSATTTSNGGQNKEQAEVGSPTLFNTSLGTQALLKSASIQSVLAHSTPTLELEDVPPEPASHQPESELPPSQQKQPHQQPQQQQQRQNNYSHQRYRGRNRR
ncbi:uncharacterized protein LOC117890310 isoform X6 [Drosophila subobscura]|uniref:uncharacterized protein LOC117890310 isoform X6 n=1 Tax=Drosophila subobscura TaxID=7241 RepID=UPI00155AF439|nr:uncharacterized protein LOC117890310 isoform X6 [Drosophila subobscura]